MVRRAHWTKKATFALALMCASWVHAQDKPQLDLPRTHLMAGMYQIEVQIAQTPPQMSAGLMFRKKMPPHEGMLFIFAEPATQCFWMKNTFIPLTAAFVGDDGTIVNLADMEPHTTKAHCSAQPVRYVLEMNQGWFAQKNIAAGFKLRGKPFAQ